jgi:hypothetical protein
LTRTTSMLYFLRAVYACGGHESSDEKRSVRSWIIENVQEYWRKILTDNMIRSGSCRD